MLDTVLQQAGANAWRCVAPQPVVTCVGGTIRNNQCICPSGTVGEQFGTNAWRCVATVPAQITCAGGSVVNGQCVCPQGSTRRQEHKDADEKFSSRVRHRE